MKARAWAHLPAGRPAKSLPSRRGRHSGSGEHPPHTRVTSCFLSSDGVTRASPWCPESWPLPGVERKRPQTGRRQTPVSWRRCRSQPPGPRPPAPGPDPSSPSRPWPQACARRCQRCTVGSTTSERTVSLQLRALGAALPSPTEPRGSSQGRAARPAPTASFSGAPETEPSVPAHRIPNPPLSSISSAGTAHCRPELPPPLLAARGSGAGGPAECERRPSRGASHCRAHFNADRCGARSVPASTPALSAGQTRPSARTGAPRRPRGRPRAATYPQVRGLACGV
ncbi:translation initiation factor IF-2 [Phyllostomus discolor]|uniref:Translation initiation factor IF-2 n=1 Tax=Phyllostomus discolor TaxID=89673 RepID=A0A6J2MN74_9CHIR|nr:translation initiation factor IF-2 [Phyllostomus discolor]